MNSVLWVILGVLAAILHIVYSAKTFKNLIIADVIVALILMALGPFGLFAICAAVMILSCNFRKKIWSSKK